MLEPTFKGSNIAKDGGNNNLAQLNDPKIDAAMDKAALLEGDERLKAWADIDKMIVGRRPGHPVRLGQDDDRAVQERQRGRQPLLHGLGLPFTSLK